MQELQVISSLALDGVTVLDEPGRRLNDFVPTAQYSLRSTSKTAIFATKALGVF